jgi:hypothetical protein
VAMTAATRNPVKPMSTSIRASAQPRRAARIPNVGEGRLPNGRGGLAG